MGNGQEWLRICPTEGFDTEISGLIPLIPPHTHILFLYLLSTLKE